MRPIKGPVARLRARAGRMRHQRALRSGSDAAPAAPAARAAAGSAADPVLGPLPADQFVNPVFEGADPFVIRDGTGYLWCQTVADRGVAVARSDRLTSLGDRRVVWRAPEEGPFSREIWAPELIRLDDRWHIYLAASDGHNRNHRAYVLVADTDDPQGSYTLHGPLATGDDGGPAQWAIDLTVLEHAGRRYALWSGWPDEDAPVQHLYIAPMASPTELAGPRLLIGRPDDYPWERIRDDEPEGINEGPQVLVNGGRTFVIYSCGSALLPSYKLGLLELVGEDPLAPESWRKHPEPIFTSTEESFGVGHGTFVRSPDDSEWWHVYHRKIVPQRNFKRVVQVQPMTWSATGEPVLGSPVTAGVPLGVPAGTPYLRRTGAAAWSFGDGASVRSDFDYYGHQQFLDQDDAGLHLGKVPEQPVNAFRSGEKLVLRDGEYADVRVRCDFRVADGDRGAGVLLRTTAAAVGVDAQRGYFVGWVPRASRLLIGRTDGAEWTVLAAQQLAAPVEGVRLVAEAVGSRISARLDGVAGSEVVANDDHYPTGSVGMRVVHTHAVITSFEVSEVLRR